MLASGSDLTSTNKWVHLLPVLLIHLLSDSFSSPLIISFLLHFCSSQSSIQHWLIRVYAPVAISYKNTTRIPGLTCVCVFVFLCSVIKAIVCSNCSFSWSLLWSGNSYSISVKKHSCRKIFPFLSAQLLSHHIMFFFGFNERVDVIINKTLQIGPYNPRLIVCLSFSLPVYFRIYLRRFLSYDPNKLLSALRKWFHFV